jgi:hypothetical protein
MALLGQQGLQGPHANVHLVEVAVLVVGRPLSVVVVLRHGA